ncbi:MAG TPA: hypothetical protein VMW12_01635 [Candidatus Dormibacteraeota bacterium]|nr:hypothetical protein [Candidatus Dormibacteraeota bacterium]
MSKSRYPVVIAMLLAVGTTPLSAGAQTAPAPAAPLPGLAASAASQNPAIESKAVEWLERVQSGNVDRSQLNKTIDAKLTPQMLTTLQKQLAPLGQPYGAAYGGSKMVGQTTVYRYVVAFKAGSIEEYISFDQAGKISGLVFTK